MTTAAACFGDRRSAAITATAVTVAIAVTEATTTAITNAAATGAVTAAARAAITTSTNRWLEIRPGRIDLTPRFSEGVPAMTNSCWCFGFDGGYP